MTSSLSDLRANMVVATESNNRRQQHRHRQSWRLVAVLFALADKLRSIALCLLHGKVTKRLQWLWACSRGTRRSVGRAVIEDARAARSLPALRPRGWCTRAAYPASGHASRPSRIGTRDRTSDALTASSTSGLITRRYRERCTSERFMSADRMFRVARGMASDSGHASDSEASSSLATTSRSSSSSRSRSRSSRALAFRRACSAMSRIWISSNGEDTGTCLPKSKI